MALTAGTRLGPYEIAAQIGLGAMGEVYGALDTNLARQVAIKVPPATFADDPERLTRFEREAKTLASLSHANIAIIHGTIGTISSGFRKIRYAPPVARPSPPPRHSSRNIRVAHGAPIFDDCGGIRREMFDELEFLIDVSEWPPLPTGSS